MVELKSREDLIATAKLLKTNTPGDEYYLDEGDVWHCRWDEQRQRWYVRDLSVNELKFDNRPLLELEQRLDALRSQVGFETPAVALDAVVTLIHRLLVERA